MKLRPDGMPRRNDLTLLTSPEQAIRAAILVVEAAGAHVLLTDAVVLLLQAKDKVADFVELPEKQRRASLGRVGYDAYCRSAGGVSLVSGAKLPPWEELSDAIRCAWESAAESIAGFQMMGSPDAA